jgi:hypothetical protein
MHVPTPTTTSHNNLQKIKPIQSSSKIFHFLKIPIQDPRAPTLWLLTVWCWIDNKIAESKPTTMDMHIYYIWPIYMRLMKYAYKAKNEPLSDILTYYYVPMFIFAIWNEKLFPQHTTTASDHYHCYTTTWVVFSASGTFEKTNIATIHTVLIINLFWFCINYSYPVLQHIIYYAQDVQYMYIDDCVTFNITSQIRADRASMYSLW